MNCAGISSPGRDTPQKAGPDLISTGDGRNRQVLLEDLSLTSLSVPDNLSELVVGERQGHIRDIDEQIKMNPGFALSNDGRELDNFRPGAGDEGEDDCIERRC